MPDPRIVRGIIKVHDPGGDAEARLLKALGPPLLNDQERDRLEGLIRRMMVEPITDEERTEFDDLAFRAELEQVSDEEKVRRRERRTLLLKREQGTPLNEQELLRLKILRDPMKPDGHPNCYSSGTLGYCKFLSSELGFGECVCDCWWARKHYRPWRPWPIAKEKTRG